LVPSYPVYAGYNFLTRIALLPS